jgi:hypothetical protein
MSYGQVGEWVERGIIVRREEKGGNQCVSSKGGQSSTLLPEHRAQWIELVVGSPTAVQIIYLLLNPLKSP